MGSSRIVAVVLAAGQSRRFGGVPKQLLPFPPPEEGQVEESLVHRAARTAAFSGAAAVIVVLGHHEERIRRDLEDLAARSVSNPRYREGQSTSVRAGLQAALELEPRAGGVLFLPCDQPLIDAALLNRLIATSEENPQHIVLPTHRDRRGAPVLFPRRFFEELAHVTGDEGGRQVIRRHPDAVTTIELDDEGPLLDVDTLDGYRELLRRLRSQESA